MPNAQGVYSLSEIYDAMKTIDELHGGVNWPGRFIATAIVYRESGGDPKAFRPASKNPRGGDDRGWWQINSKAWPGVPDSVAFDPMLATEWAYKQTNGFAGKFGTGGNWKPWEGNKILIEDPGKIAELMVIANKAGDPDSSVTGTPDYTVPGVGTALEAAQTAIRILASAGAWIANPQNWVRVLEVVGGAGLVAAGILVLAKDLTPLGAVAKLAGK